jgi:lipoprotein-anchoring transpeptidase ErfK/SrfK
MRLMTSLFWTLGLLILNGESLALGAVPLSPEAESAAGAIVCPPGIYASAPGDCVPLGPAASLSYWAVQGIPYPAKPLPAYPPDSALSQVPYYYYKLDQVPVDVYPSLESAQSQTGAVRTFQPGFVYVTYLDVVQDRGYYFMLSDYQWIPGKGSRIGQLPTFQGLQFSSPPQYSFGWTFEHDLPVRNAPGFNAVETGRKLALYEVTPVYAVQEVDGYDWYLIAPGQWVEGRKVGRVVPNPVPPEGVTNDRWIEVNLEEQTLAVYDQRKLVFATLIASGVEPMWTRPGLFQIYEKKETETMRNNDPAEYYYLDKVPWTMYFDQARALHGAYWRTRFGYPQSHGCVNLSIGDAHWLFDWAEIGDWVYIHDPSGKTPTDPSLYGAGAP